VAILLAFGINLIASVVYTSLSTPVALLWGSIVTLSSLLYLGLRYLKRQHRVVFEGFLVYDPSIQLFLPVAEYDLAEKVEGYLKAAFAENKALLKQWNENPFRPDIGREGFMDSASVKILQEALEYYVLDRLSLHLGAYFAKSGTKASFLQHLGRSDIPGGLLSNRFLDLFSRPMIDRPAFEEMNEGYSIVRIDASGKQEVVGA
jgi:hypothetical protein